MEGIEDIEYCNFYISENENGSFDIYDCNDELLDSRLGSIEECKARIDEEYEVNGYLIQWCDDDNAWNIYDENDNLIARDFNSLKSAQAHAKYEL